jgi:ribosomal protein S17E
MGNNQTKRCAKGLHQYREKILTDFGGNKYKVLTCIYCPKQLKKPIEK